MQKLRAFCENIWFSYIRQNAYLFIIASVLDSLGFLFMGLYLLLQLPFTSTVSLFFARELSLIVSTVADLETVLPISAYYDPDGYLSVFIIENHLLLAKIMGTIFIGTALFRLYCAKMITERANRERKQLI